MQCKVFLIIILQFHVHDEQRCRRRGVRKRDLRPEVEIDRPVGPAVVLQTDDRDARRDVRHDGFRAEPLVRLRDPAADDVLYGQLPELLQTRRMSAIVEIALEMDGRLLG